MYELDVHTADKLKYEILRRVLSLKSHFAHNQYKSLFCVSLVQWVQVNVNQTKCSME